jgi:hypothetical protein
LANDLVVACGQQKAAVGGKRQNVTSAGPSAGLNDELRLVSGPALLLIGSMQESRASDKTTKHSGENPFCAHGPIVTVEPEDAAAEPAL